MRYSIYQSPSLSIARVSPPRSALIFSNSAGPHQGLSCKPCNVLRQELLLSLSSLFSSSQALISQRPSSTSSSRVRHHCFASPERYIVAIVTWSSKGARTALKYCSMSHFTLAFLIPLNGCGKGTQMRLESPGETFGSRTYDLSPQQAPKFYLVRHALDIATGIVEAP